jgi:hypothetical protein
MAGMEGVIRPFVGSSVSPVPIHHPGAANVPPVRFAIGDVGGTKTFSYSGSSSLSSYMATINTEKTSTAFDMTTGELKR